MANDCHRQEKSDKFQAPFGGAQLGKLFAAVGSECGRKVSEKNADLIFRSLCVEHGE